MTAVDNSFKPSIEKCLGYWYGGRHNPAELEECQLGSKPPLQCMFDQLEFCKGLMLIELADSSSTLITAMERELLWRAAFGQELVSKKNKSCIIRAGFLQWLLTNPQAVKLISTNGIRAKGIIIDGDLNLENVTINFPVALEKFQFQGNINLTDAKTSFLSLKGSNCSSEYDLRLKGTSDGNSEEIIRQFRMEFESEKQKCAVLIVRAASNSEKWILAGFDDAGKFREVPIDSSHELSKELKRESRNELRIFQLATSRLGRTPSFTINARRITVKGSFQLDSLEAKKLTFGGLILVVILIVEKHILSIKVIKPFGLNILKSMETCF